jgi:hypothetical protein
VRGDRRVEAPGGLRSRTRSTGGRCGRRARPPRGRRGAASTLLPSRYFVEDRRGEGRGGRRRDAAGQIALWSMQACPAGCAVSRATGAQGDFRERAAAPRSAIRDARRGRRSRNRPTVSSFSVDLFKARFGGSAEHSGSSTPRPGWWQSWDGLWYPPRPRCDCDVVAEGPGELKLHPESQDTEGEAWSLLLRLVDEAAADGRKRFSPGADIPLDLWPDIVTLGDASSGSPES